MRNVSLEPSVETAADIQLVYDRFDIGLDGKPTPAWEAKNLKKFKGFGMFQFYWFPDCYLKHVLVNRKMVGALAGVFGEFASKWDRAVYESYGLQQFVCCYAFGHGIPSLHWYGAAWELSPRVPNDVLPEVSDIFRRHGFSNGDASNGRKKLRTFEYW